MKVCAKPSSFSRTEEKEAREALSDGEIDRDMADCLEERCLSMGKAPLSR